MTSQQSQSSQAGKFNYAEALQKSFLFYEAQRAGDLDEKTNRIPWRVDSTLNDGKDVGRDLSKGYFDAGDHVKYGLPMASTMTMLAWGVPEFGDAYKKIGQLDESLDAIKWGADYILNAYDDNGTAATADDVFYGQVANGHVDHSYWGPPETLTMERPIYQIDAANPGSDLAGQAASALASASIIFRPTDTAYADKLLAQAQKLYAFAETYRGKYSDTLTKADAGNFYESFNSYTDELAFGAMWLHKATKAAGQTDPQYLNKAEQYRQEVEDANFIPANNEGLTQNWFNNTPAVDVMLAQETGNPKHQARAEQWLDQWMPNTSQGSFVEYTDGGFAWTYKWGALRHTSNAAMLAGIYANTVNDKGGEYSQFVEQQINYMLGDNPNNRSYVVGFGENSPQNPHHRGAHGSTTNNIANPTETQNVLYGALVGGPTAPDDNAWKDDRTDYVANEVALDYNAGFTGALAYMVDKYGGAPLPDSEIPKLFDKADVDFTITQDWGSGFKGQIDITNTGYRELDDWTLEFDFDNEITQIWNAEIVSHTGNTYVIRNADWNDDLAVGEMVSFGFLGKDSVASEPSSFEFNAPTFAPSAEADAQVDPLSGAPLISTPELDEAPFAQINSMDGVRHSGQSLDLLTNSSEIASLEQPSHNLALEPIMGGSINGEQFSGIDILGHDNTVFACGAGANILTDESLPMAS